MNTNTGSIYTLPEGVVGPSGFVELPILHEIGKQSAFAAYKDEIAAAARDIEAGDPIVPVSPQVAQKMKIGEREFKRRKNRRKKARRS